MATTLVTSCNNGLDLDEYSARVILAFELTVVNNRYQWWRVTHWWTLKPTSDRGYHRFLESPTQKSRRNKQLRGLFTPAYVQASMTYPPTKLHKSPRCGEIGFQVRGSTPSQTSVDPCLFGHDPDRMWLLTNNLRNQSLEKKLINSSLSTICLSIYSLSLEYIISKAWYV